MSRKGKGEGQQKRGEAQEGGRDRGNRDVMSREKKARKGVGKGASRHALVLQVPVYKYLHAPRRRDQIDDTGGGGASEDDDPEAVKSWVG